MQIARGVGNPEGRGAALRDPFLCCGALCFSPGNCSYLVQIRIFPIAIEQPERLWAFGLLGPLVFKGAHSFGCFDLEVRLRGCSEDVLNVLCGPTVFVIGPIHQGDTRD